MLVVVGSFMVFRSFAPAYNYIFSTLGAAGIIALFSTGKQWSMPRCLPVAASLRRVGNVPVVILQGLIQTCPLREREKKKSLQKYCLGVVCFLLWMSWFRRDVNTTINLELWNFFLFLFIFLFLGDYS